jgi:hypothetical protein
VETVDRPNSLRRIVVKRLDYKLGRLCADRSLNCGIHCEGRDLGLPHGRSNNTNVHAVAASTEECLVRTSVAIEVGAQAAFRFPMHISCASDSRPKAVREEAGAETVCKAVAKRTARTSVE